MRWWAYLSLTLMALGGCSDSGGDLSPDLKARAQAVDAFCLAYWSKRVQRDAACWGLPERFWDRQAAASCARLKAAVAAGALDFDAQRAPGCLAAVEIAGCPFGIGITPIRRCRDVLLGRQGTGAACQVHLGFEFLVQECQPADVCSADWLLKFQCGGRCEPLRSEGQSCADRGCAPGFTCREDLPGAAGAAAGGRR